MTGPFAEKVVEVLANREVVKRLRKLVQGVTAEELEAEALQLLMEQGHS